MERSQEQTPKRKGRQQVVAKTALEPEGHDSTPPEEPSKATKAAAPKARPKKKDAGAGKSPVFFFVLWFLIPLVLIVGAVLIMDR